MMDQLLPKVSIVLPTYNGSAHLKNSINSCLNQTYNNIELIIVDDGSTDATPQLIGSFKDSRIKYVRHKKNVGLPEALNTGFANTQGEYLTWTSDDNEFLPNAIEEMVNFLERNRDIGLVYADYWAHYLETGAKELRRMPDVLNIGKENVVGSCFMYTRRVYEAVGDYDPKFRLVEDYEYWIRISKRFKVMHYPKALYIYGEHSKTLKSTKQSGILLFRALLRYANNFVTLSEFDDLIHASYISLFDVPKSSAKGSLRKMIRYFHDIVKSSRISLGSCVLCFLLLFRQLMWKGAKSFFSKAIFYPYEYIGFILFSRFGLSKLRVVEGHRNVLCIVPHIVLGGADHVVLNIAKALGNEKFIFHIVTSSMLKNTWQNKFQGIFVNVITPRKRTKSIYYRYFELLIKKLNIEVVLITNSIVGYEYLPRMKFQFPNVKTIDLLHAENYPPIQLEKFAQYIDTRICISHRLKNYMMVNYQRSGIDTKFIERLKVIHNGINTANFDPNVNKKGEFKMQFAIPENQRIISFIGRFSPEKNPLLFVEIAKNLVENYPFELKFVMAGEGPEIGKIKDLIRCYGLENHFILSGMIDNVARLLKDTYVLLVVSRSEGIPLVILEAMNMGVPVISTNVGAISEVIENNTDGFLIDPDSDIVESFVGRILNLLSGKIDYGEFSSKSIVAISPRFTLETMASEYQKYFY
jgi:glycosyltransferase involved in cell wall biosynthesis/GT2 family glycosyltransferase